MVAVNTNCVIFPIIEVYGRFSHYPQTDITSLAPVQGWEQWNKVLTRFNQVTSYQKETTVDDLIAAGTVRRFSSMDALIADLDATE